MDAEEMSILLMEVMELDAQPEIDLAQFGERWMYRDWDLAELEDAIRDRALPVREMMTPEQLYVLERLPEVLTVYRGTWEGAPVGASWSLRRRSAAKFGATRTASPLTSCSSGAWRSPP
jgi:hypothetical protein